MSTFSTIGESAVFTVNSGNNSELVNKMDLRVEQDTAVNSGNNSGTPKDNMSLTPEQIAILQMLIDGKPFKQIAQEIGATESLVKVRIWRARKKVGDITLYQLIAISVGLGICTIDRSLAFLKDARKPE